MNSRLPMTSSSLRTTGAWLLAWVVALNVPYAALIQLFGYDDVLREPPGVVLERFHAAGEPLVWAWLAFALGALAFAPLSRRVELAAGLAPGWSGPASAFAQFAGLARWVFAVPSLASAYVAGDEATRRAAESTYAAVHGYLGAGIGETLGQLLVLVWTGHLARALWRQGRRALASIGGMTMPLWLAGLSEPLHSVLPSLPVIESTPLAFMVWEAWLAALAIAWLLASRRVPHAAAVESAS
jgi:hypothetical protein